MTLGKNDQATVVANFQIPADAEPGLISTVVFTATSQLDFSSNSATSDLFVLSPVGENNKSGGCCFAAAR